MSALKVLFIGGTGADQRRLLATRGRTRDRRPRAQPRRDGDPPAPHRRPVLESRHPRRGRRPRRAARTRVRLRRELPGLHPRARRGRPRDLRRAHRPVRLHQLGVGLPEARRPAAVHRVDAAAQSDLAVLAGQDRLRGAARRAPTASTAFRPRSSGPRTPTTARRCRAKAAGPSSIACAEDKRSSSTATAPRCGRSRTPATSPRGSSACSATRKRSARASTSPPTRSLTWNQIHEILRRGRRHHAPASSTSPPTRSSPPTSAGAAACSATRPTP